MPFSGVRPAGLSDSDSDSDGGLASYKPRAKPSALPLSSGTSSSQGNDFSSMSPRPRRPAVATPPPLENLRTAIAQGSLADVKILVNQGISVNQLLKNNWSPLLCACAGSSVAVVRYLIEQGADVNMHKDLYTPLMAVCGSARHDDEAAAAVVDLLLERGAAPSAADRHRSTALMYAAKEGKAATVRRLLAAGADAGKQDTMGWTAMMQAASRGYGHIVRHLVEAGASAATYNLSGQTAGDLAMANGYHAIADLLQRAQGGAEEVTSDQLATLREKETAQNQQTLSGVFGELEMVLSGLELQHLIPLFHAHAVGFASFLRFTDDDLDRMKIEKVGERRKILDGIREIHVREWERSSLPALHYNKYLTCPDAVALMMNVSRHLRLIHASVGYLRDQLQARSRVLELGQDSAGVASLVETTTETSRHLRGLHQELKFLSLHLKKVKGCSEYLPADLKVSAAPGRLWRRRITTWALLSAALAVLAARRWPQAASRLLATLTAKRAGSVVTIV